MLSMHVRTPGRREEHEPLVAAAVAAMIRVEQEGRAYGHREVR